MKNIKINDLYEFDFINEIKSSKNGKYLAFSVNNAVKKDNKYSSKIYVFEHENQELSALNFDEFEDKLKIINVSDIGEITVLAVTKNKEENEKNNVLIKKNIKHDNCNPTIVFTFEKKPEKIFYIDDENIYWTARIEKSEENIINNFTVLDELPFWSNGKGLIDKSRMKLFIKEKGNTLRIIGNENEDISNFEVSENGEYIVYISREFQSLDNLFNSVNLLKKYNGETVNLHSSKEKLIFQDLCFIDEDNIFLTAFDNEFPGKNNLAFIYNLREEKNTNLPFFDINFSGTQVTDIKFGSPIGKLIGKNEKLYFTASQFGNTYLYSLDKKNKLNKLTDDSISIIDFAIVNDGFYTISLPNDKLHKILFHPERENELNFSLNKILFNFNKKYEDSHLINKTERFLFTNRDGIDIEVFVLIPENIKDKKIPVILQIHGGPKTVYGRTFNHEFQVLASEGFASVFLNPRGSDGRGSDFANLVGELGFIDYEDIMEGYEEALKRYPILDKDKAGVSGGSYGGLMVNWIISHTSRFKAACSQRSISSYLTKPFTTDIGYFHNLKQIGVSPWEDFERVNLHSPLAYEKNIRTPTLFIHSDEDYRCWQVEGISMYNALKRNGVPSKMVLFYGENHGLSRSGKPHNRVKRLDEIAKWFCRFLKD